MEEPTPEQARALLQAERMERQARCQQAIQEALAAHRCRLVAQPVIDGEGRVRARVVVQAQE